MLADNVVMAQSGASGCCHRLAVHIQIRGDQKLLMSISVIFTPMADLAWRHSNSAIKSNYFTIQHRVLDDVVYHFGVFFGLAQT